MEIFRGSQNETIIRMSKLSQQHVATLLKAVGVAAVTEEPPAQLLTTAVHAALPDSPADFPWPQADEEKDITGAIEYVRQRVTEQAVPIPPDPNNVAHLGAFKLLDVHGNKQLLTVEVGKQKLTGGTDAVIVPRRVAAAFPAFQARVFFDFKLPAGQVDAAQLSDAFASLHVSTTEAHCMSMCRLFCSVRWGSPRHGGSGARGAPRRLLVVRASDPGRGHLTQHQSLQSLLGAASARSRRGAAGDLLKQERPLQHRLAIHRGLAAHGGLGSRLRAR